MKISLCSTYFCPWKNWRTDHSQNIYGIYQHVFDLAFHYLWTLSTHITLANENKRPPHCFQREARWPWSGFSEQRERRPEKLFHSSPTSSLVSPVVVKQQSCLKLTRGAGAPIPPGRKPAGPAHLPGSLPHPHRKQQLPLLLSPNLNPDSSWGIFYFFNIWHNFNSPLSCITQVWHPRKKPIPSIWFLLLVCELNDYYATSTKLPYAYVSICQQSQASEYWGLFKQKKIQDGPKMEHGQEGVSFSLSPNRGSRASTLHVHVAQLPLCPGIFPCDTKLGWNSDTWVHLPLLHFSQRLHFKNPSYAPFESAFLF